MLGFAWVKWIARCERRLGGPVFWCDCAMTVANTKEVPGLWCFVWYNAVPL